MRANAGYQALFPSGSAQCARKRAWGTRLEKMVATELLKLAMETEEGRKERLKKMVANHSAEASP